MATYKETKMKNSGVEWIGEIPEDWDVTRSKNIFTQRSSRGNDVEEQLAATQQHGMYPQKLLEGVVQVKEDTDLQQFKTVHKNDYVISLRSFQGGFEMSDYEGVCSPAYQVFYNTIPISYRYYKYLFKSDGFISKMNSLTVGIREGKNIQYKDFSNSPIIIPPKSTQQRIASYLDKKCSKIEETIQNQQQVIEKLKAYKQSLITEAVTGKIKIQNGKVCGKYQSYKESGVEWIGKIPSEWSCVQIKNIFRFLGGYAFNSEDYVDETEYQILRIGNVKDFKILFDSSPAYISKETALKVENFKLKAGYILFTMTGTRGKKDYFYTHKVTDADCTKKNIYLNQRVGCLIPNSNISSSYFNYLLKDNLIKDSVFLSETGTANQANIGSDDVMRIKLHCPPKEEQKEIADYLDKKCTAIDTAIEQKQNLIEKLTEYKKSLIYECVTGKKEI
mgnify:CR=1 FL=1